MPPLDDKAIKDLLGRSDRSFSKDEKANIQILAGGHPYLLQVAASSLWDAYEEESDPLERWRLTGERLFRQVESVLVNTWENWSPETKKVFVIVALDSMPDLLGEKHFAISNFIKSLPDHKPELRDLKTRGFIREDTNPNLESGYSVSAAVILLWLADQLIAALRSDDDLGAWLCAQQWDGMLTSGEKSQLLKAASSLSGLLKSGVEAFIKAAAEGFGKGIFAVK